MAFRTLCFILIAAVLTCPYGHGFGSCCAGIESVSNSHCVDCVEHPCESGLVHDDGHSDDEQSRPCPRENLPSDDPCEHDKTCQGICGGAVLEKPFVPLFDLAFVPLVDLKWSADQSISKRRCLSAHAEPIFGRALRTLYMSFLC